MLKLGFYGAAGEVTGSNHLIDTGEVKILIDCGFFQGMKICDDKNNSPFAYDPKNIDALFVTHAHLDHIGRIPKLFNEGFKGKIYSTPPTRQIAQVILEDSVNVIEHEAKSDNHEPLYREDAVSRAFEHWEVVPYDEEVVVGDLHIRFRDAGHILGSAMVEIERNGKKLVCSGDLGNSPSLLLPDTEPLSGINYLVMEAVYGDRRHEDRDARTRLLEETIEGVVKKKGVLMIPAFSTERTQELLYELNNLVENKRIPEIPVFVDSPLAIKVTDIYQQNQSYFNKETQADIKGGDEIFKFPRLRFTKRVEDSIAIKDVPAPKIIIAGSGMSNGGRILHHEKNYLSDPKNTLLLIGYQAIGTMGRAIQEGIKKVNIFHEEVSVQAQVTTINGYSAHKDVDALLEFVGTMQDTVKKVFVVHAEPGAALFFTQRVRDYLGIDARIPKEGEMMEIDM